MNYEITDESIGCVSQMEDYMVSLIGPHATMLLASSAFNIISMLVACCMFWKRKEYDVFPEFRAPKVPVSVWIIRIRLFSFLSK